MASSPILLQRKLRLLLGDDGDWNDDDGWNDDFDRFGCSVNGGSSGGDGGWNDGGNDDEGGSFRDRNVAQPRSRGFRQEWVAATTFEAVDGGFWTVAATTFGDDGCCLLKLNLFSPIDK